MSTRAVIVVASGLRLAGVLTVLAGAVLAARRYRRGECAGGLRHVSLGVLAAAAGWLLLVVRGGA